MKIAKTTLITASIAAVLALGPALPLPAQAADPAEQRTAGQMLDDGTITASVKTRLLADERTQAFDINVGTTRGHVTLTGGTDSEAAKRAATELATATRGVSSVDNQLVVAAPGSQARQAANEATASGKARATMSDTGEVIDDSWITARVKTQLLADRELPGMQISVETRDNVVHLSGEVDSTGARAEAIRIAEDTRGVQSVNAERLVVRGS